MSAWIADCGKVEIALRGLLGLLFESCGGDGLGAMFKILLDWREASLNVDGESERRCSS